MKPLRLMWTLALDWKAPLTESVEEPFLRAGTYHIFAVDGLRVGIAGGHWRGAVARAARLPRPVAGWRVIPVIWFYVGLTGWPASAVRAGIMMSLVIAGWAAKRPGDLINSLFAAALIILVWDPQQLFQAGFQLSFVIVLCIGLLVLPMRRALHREVFSPGAISARRVAAGLADLAGWAAAVGAGHVRDVAGGVAGVHAAGGLVFSSFHAGGRAGQLVVVPLTALALMSCMGSLLAGGWFPGLAILFNHSGWFWMKCIIGASQWSAHWPAGNWYVSAPRPATIVWYYLALLTVLTGWIFRTKHRRWVLAALVLASALWVVDWNHRRGTARIDVLALRGAPAVFAGGQDLLADCGDAGPAEEIVKPFLHGRGVNGLENFCLTAGHQQSVGGAEIILTNFARARVFAGPARVRWPAYRRLAAELGGVPGRWRVAQAGDEVDGWSVLGPGGGDPSRAGGRRGAGLATKHPGHSVLLLSTLGRAGQDLLRQRHPELRAEIVVAGCRPGTNRCPNRCWISIQPKLIIIGNSDFPATRRAAPKLRERLARRGGARVIYCRDAGSITLLLRREGWSRADRRSGAGGS